MNPRLVWCYQGEDFMGHCRRLALASTKGQRIHQVPIKCVQRYLNAMDMLLDDPTVWFRKFIARRAEAA
jgi:hypothetical protein